MRSVLNSLVRFRDQCAHHALAEFFTGHGQSGSRRQEVFNSEGIGRVLLFHIWSATGRAPEADPLQTRILRRLSGEGLTILKTQGWVGEVIRFGNVIDLWHTERRQGGVSVIQDALQ